jgi:hypothetical protein
MILGLLGQKGSTKTVGPDLTTFKSEPLAGMPCPDPIDQAIADARPIHGTSCKSYTENLHAVLVKTHNPDRVSRSDVWRGRFHN